MIDRYFTQSKTRNRLQNGPIGPLFPAFITELENRGHSMCSIRRMIRTADRLGRWIQDHGVLLYEANQDHIDLYLAEQGRRLDKRRNSGHLPQPALYLRTITEVLKRQGIFNRPVKMTEVARWGDRFSEYLIQVRGASPSQETTTYAMRAG